MTENCASCGRVADPDDDGDPPFAWSAERTAGHTRWLCPACTRANVRAIEAKLDDAWW